LNPIGWATDTWSPVTGCSPVSPACDHCYAERMATRLAGRFGYAAEDPFQVTFHPDRLDQPLKWKKPRRVFVCSMGDLFHEDVPDEWLEAVFGVMAARPEHTFLLLTKRPERARAWSTRPDIARHVDRMKQIALAGRIGEYFAPERTLPIAGWPGYYVTSKGRVFSDRTHAGSRNPEDLHELKLGGGNSGHVRAMLQVQRQVERILVHRLVLEVFDRAAGYEEQGCHIDGDPTNNALWNLRWGTQGDNWGDSRRHGTARRYHKLTEEQVAEIRTRFSGGESACSLAPQYGVSDTQIRNVCTGGHWPVPYEAEWPLGHCWLGVTVENQAQARDRIGWLFSTPAANRFVSCEPLLGPLDLTRIEVLPEEGNQPGVWLNALTGHVIGPDDMMPEKLDWVIAGAETGPGARPADPAWFRSLRDQCQGHIPFYLKDHPGTIDGVQYREIPEGMAL